MTLTNYWWLLIWLFLGGAIFNNMPKRLERLDGKTVERWDIWPAILMVLPYIIWAGFRKDFGDTYVYRQGFQSASGGLTEALQLFTNDSKDPGYYAFLIIMKSILGNQEEIYFTMIAFMQLLCIALVFRQYSTNYWACIFLLWLSALVSRPQNIVIVR